MTKLHICAALAVVFFAVRLIHLHADPPRVPNGQGGAELVVEAPAKAYEARKLALFGRLATAPADAYRIWSAQAPAYVFPLAGFMSVAGVGHAQVRLYGVLIGLAGYVLLLAALYRHVRVLPLLLVGLLATVHFYYFHYLRAGLLEPQVNTWIIAAVFAALLGRRNPYWLLGVPLAWSLAFLTKSTAVVFLPLLTIALLVVVLSERERIGRRHVIALGLASLLCAVTIALVVRQETYVRAAAWNYQHMFNARESFTGPTSSLWDLVGSTVSRLFDPGRWTQAVLLVVPVCFPLAVAHVARTGALLARRRQVPAISWITVLWFLSGLAAMFAIAHARGRFSHILLPPALLLFALELDLWMKKWKSPRVSAALAVGVAAAVVATHGRWSYDWLVDPRDRVHRANVELDAYLEEDDVVAGFRAPLLAFDSDADILYVKRWFNDDPEHLLRSGVTHLLVSGGEPAARITRKHFPDAYAGRHKVATVSARGRRYTLYELADPPLAAASSQALEPAP